MTTYQNPIQKHGDFADPFVLRFNGRYYLYCTNPGVRCWQSDDLLHWTLIGEVVAEDEFPGLVPFAPEVVYENGWFYMYTSPHGLGHYVLRSDFPLGPFRKITPNIGHAIDFSVFIDDDGAWYAYCADDRGILGCRMTSPTKFGAPQYIGAYLHGWTEGPFVVKRDGVYHLTYTGNHFLSKGYRIQGASAAHPLGPFTDYGHNPLAVRTEGSVVGLGHSSTVCGPDLMSDWMFYHNLNPDKTRDLDLDRVLFRGRDSFLLGPTAAPMPAPKHPDYQDLFTAEAGEEWRMETGGWRAENGFRVSGGAIRAICAHPLPEHGAAEVHVAAASEKTGAYGICLAGQTLLIFRETNRIRLLDADGTARWEMALPEGFRHDALHSIMLRWDGAFTAYLDHLLLRDLTLHLSGAHVGYFADGAARFGSVTISGKAEGLCVPTQTLVPAMPAFSLAVPTDGAYLCTLYGQSDVPARLRVDGEEALPQCETDNIATFRLTLSTGLHDVQISCMENCRIRFDPLDTIQEETLTAAMERWDKQTGKLRFSDVEIHAHLCPRECGGSWEAGILLRAQNLADGGEGSDKQLGTNFFVGYRIAVCNDQVRLYKHCYDETLLTSAPLPVQPEYDLTVRCIADTLTISSCGTELLSYVDDNPLMTGRAGFHSRACELRGSSLTLYAKETSIFGGNP